MLDRPQLLNALAAECAAFHEAVATTALSAPVPSCPEWTVEDLVHHVGVVHHFWGQVVERRLTEPSVEAPPRPPADQIVGWAAGEADAMLRILTATDPATPVWTWSSQKDVAFVVRRMAQETAVHGWDARLAAGTLRPVPAELASDGIDEFLTVFLPQPYFGGGRIEGSVHVHATDTPGEWLVVEADDGALTITAEHAKGDAALRGPASDLLLVLWHRRPLDAVEVIGDRAVAERLLARTTVA